MNDNTKPGGFGDACKVLAPDKPSQLYRQVQPARLYRHAGRDAGIQAILLASINKPGLPGNVLLMPDLLVESGRVMPR